MSLLAASEKDTGQTESLSKGRRRCGELYPKQVIQSRLECRALESDSLVDKACMEMLDRVVHPGLDV